MDAGALGRDRPCGRLAPPLASRLARAWRVAIAFALHASVLELHTEEGTAEECTAEEGDLEEGATVEGDTEEGATEEGTTQEGATEEGKLVATIREEKNLTDGAPPRKTGKIGKAFK